MPSDAAVPDYLVRLAERGSLYVRRGNDIVDAPAADIAVLRSYPSLPGKGPLTGAAGERLTILTAKTTYAPGEEIRVIHVHEATLPGASLYVMGPKEVSGEYVDGKLASRAATVQPGAYDGAVLASPGVDTNYDITSHRLAAGRHTLQWRSDTLSGPAVLESNVVAVDVR
jgi:hypothetical protein